LEKIGTTLIGIGGYGAKLARTMEETGLFEIVACYHPDAGKNNTAAKEYGCIPVRSEDEAVSHKGVEAVVIATPDHTHLSYIQKALAHNRHVFVEKPMVSSSDEAYQLRKDLDGRDAILFVGHNMRREPAFRFIKKEYEEGRFGRLVTFQIVLSHGGAFNWSGDYWRTRPELCREGPMRINGVHASDVLEYLFGPIGSVYARIGSLFSGQQAPDSGVALVEVGNNASGTIYTHWVVPSLNRFTFQFTEAFVEFDLHHLFVRYGRDIDCLPTETREIPLPPSSVRNDQMIEFARAIRNGDEWETGWNEGYRTVLFFEACYRSHLEGRSIPVKGSI
jgi:predicted dehydrogenase